METLRPWLDILMVCFVAHRRSNVIHDGLLSIPGAFSHGRGREMIKICTRHDGCANFGDEVDMRKIKEVLRKVIWEGDAESPSFRIGR